jgi:NADPH-dependent glutamate synthase beta subunit-like oxidoreductase
MLRYGIPAYRLPRERLEDDIQCILSTGIEVKTGIEIGKDITFEELRSQFDSIYLSIGAHSDKKAGISGEDSKGVISAVEMLRGIGDGNMPDFTGKKVVVIGGGNVAMDVTRTSIRLGAEKVTCVYRRRQEDMTALSEEVEGAIAEGAELITLQAPAWIEADKCGNAKALWTQPQIMGKMDSGGRPSPQKANLPEVSIPADIIIIAIGQSIESAHFAENGIPVKRGSIEAQSNCEISGQPGVFAGGDRVTGPATVIKAIAAGKIAAANIDAYLGFNHVISTDIDIPIAHNEDRPAMGRVNLIGREASERKHDFDCIDNGMTCEGACQESCRCLRCDSFVLVLSKEVT